MMIIYSLSHIKILKLIIFNPIFIGTIIFTIIGGILAGFLLNLTLRNMIIFIIILALIPFIVLILTTSGVSYGIENNYIIIKYIRTYKIPINEANISLVPYSKVKPVFREAGVSIPGLLALGRYKFANGKHGIAIIYKPQEKALLITYDNKLFVISHPGIEKAYRELLNEIKRYNASTRP